ncbi:YcnI family protein [Microvirga zambiensis]|uniref:YcnI family protein n=1 Tax=Microvirga zambiensis TaxID=1402137 RepID=UPI00191F71CF|nr:YcnI family protein [Microvirga zambiensis]
MKSLRLSLQAGLAAAVLAAPLCAQAHVSFENKEVKIGSTVKFVLVIPHGCTGSPTVALKVSVPPELTEVKPQPKPGWSLSTTIEEQRIAAAGSDLNGHGGHGADVREISWSGGKLEDTHFDEFIFRAKVRSSFTGSEIFVPVVQQCSAGAQRWIEVPLSGRSADDLTHPAPSVKIRSGS